MSEPEQPTAERGRGSCTRFVLYCLAATPAAVALAWVIRMRTVVPEPGNWRLARQEGMHEFGWERLLDTGTFPAYFADRCLVQGLLSIPGFDFQSLRFAPWALAVLCCIVFHRLLSRHTASRGHPTMVLGGLLVFTAWTFNPAYGANWLCGERLRVFVPPLFFLTSLWVLTSGQRWRWRYYLAAALSLFALFTEKGGLFVWVALLPVVAMQARRRGVGSPWLDVGKWLVLGNLGTVLCYFVWRRGDRGPGLVARCLEDPTGTLLEFAYAIGKSVPSFLTVHRMECFAGAAQLIALVVLIGLLYKNRRDNIRLSQAIPWITFAIYGLLYPALLVDIGVVSRRGGGMLGGEWQPEHLFAGSFLLVGIAGLASIYASSLARLLFPVGIGALLVLIGQDWHRGWDHLKSVHAELSFSAAELAFLAVADAQTLPPQSTCEHAAKRIRSPTAIALVERGMLTGVPVMYSLALNFFDVQTEATPSIARGSLLELTPTRVSGIVHSRTFEIPPALVMLTRKAGVDSAERVFALVRPEFEAGGKSIPFAREFQVNPPFREGELVRAYGFEVEGRRAYPLLGQRRFGAGAFHAVKGN